MADTIDTKALPEPVVHPHRGWPSAIWIVPVLAIGLGVALGVRTYLRRGETIHITFNSADGLEAGKSDVRYKNVPVGKVRSIELSEDRQHIVANVELDRGAAALAVEDTRFWVERPRIGVGGVSGLGTLLSGAYIGVDIGTSKTETDRFTGMDDAPGYTSDQHGTRFQLIGHDAGSLAVRSPVYLRRVTVGQVSALKLAPDGKTVAVEVFIQAPYDHDVTTKSVFWNASGVDVSIDASGLRLDAQSFATVVAGGIAFGLRDPDDPGKPAVEGQSFSLFDDRGRAMTPPDGPRLIAKMRFHQDLRGVDTGTVVDLSGVRIGHVDEVLPGYDTTTHEMYFDVAASVFPERLGLAYTSLSAEGVTLGKTGPQMLQSLVGRGLRAQIRSGNLLTGSSYIAFAYFPKEKPATVVEEQGLWIVPTQPAGAGVDQLQAQVADILAKVDRIPFDTIGQDVHETTRAAAALIGDLDHDVAPEAKKLFAQAQLAMGALREGLTALRDNVAAPDSAIQQSTRSALEQVERAAFSLRSLADYVEHHPESLVRGRASGPEPKGK